MHIQGRKVAILVADGSDGESAIALHQALFAQGAVPRFVAPRIGPVATADGVAIDADASLENEPSFLFDALALANGDAGVQALAANGYTAEYILNQYRHCKPILVMPDASALMQMAKIPTSLPSGEQDPGVVMGATASDFEDFVSAITQHRHFERESDPPRV
jgi:catalase